jgi:hypothetical protein
MQWCIFEVLGPEISLSKTIDEGFEGLPWTNFSTALYYVVSEHQHAR